MTKPEPLPDSPAASTLMKTVAALSSSRSFAGMFAAPGSPPLLGFRSGSASGALGLVWGMSGPGFTNATGPTGVTGVGLLGQSSQRAPAPAPARSSRAA